MPIGLKRGTVSLASNHEEWRQEFDKEKDTLQKLLGDYPIEHIGSTAIPGLKAKPIIDMEMGVDDIKEVEKISPQLESLGYEFQPNGSDDRTKLYVKGPEENRTHYLHIDVYDSDTWKRDLYFRDYLIDHPASLKQYEELKEKLAEQYPNDRRKYSEGKKTFIESIVGPTQKRTLGGVVYRVFESPEAANIYLERTLKEEWDQDHAEFPDQPWTVEWLKRLETATFELKEVSLGDIYPREDLMNHETDAYSFKEELASRVEEAGNLLENENGIEPLIVFNGSNELVDGYMRFTLLEKSGVRSVLVYILS